MAIEIERKFLAAGDGWRDLVCKRIPILQGYIQSMPERTVRVRTSGEHGFITVKGKKYGASAPEFEYRIPYADARQMIEELCLPGVISKVRHHVPLVSVEDGVLKTHENRYWEIDEFHGQNRGLIVIELELLSETEIIPAPHWLGEDVTEDVRYLNSNLVQNPFSMWK